MKILRQAQDKKIKKASAKQNFSSKKKVLKVAKTSKRRVVKTAKRNSSSHQENSNIEARNSKQIQNSNELNYQNNFGFRNSDFGFKSDSDEEILAENGLVRVEVAFDFSEPEIGEAYVGALHRHSLERGNPEARSEKRWIPGLRPGMTKEEFKYIS